VSTNYRLLSPIHMPVLLDGRLKKFGVSEHHVAASHEWASHVDKRCLTDGLNFLWVLCDEVGCVTSFTRYALNDARRIVEVIREAFHVEIVCEHEPRYWGLETEEEWDAAQIRIEIENERAHQVFWNELVKFVRGESDRINSTYLIKSATMKMVEIAKRLIAESPELLAEDKRSDLIQALEEMYHQHLVETGEIPF
jgi:hypothetical protein